MADDMRDFAEAFGLDVGSSGGSDDQADDNTEMYQAENLDSEEETGSDQGTEESDDEEVESESGSESSEEQPDKSKSQQNFAFAKLRNENKKLNKVLRDVGQILGLDDNIDSNKILEGVEQAVLNQKAKDQGIPVETLQKITELENLVEENRRIKLEKDTSETLTALIDEFNLSDEQLSEFTAYLIENDLNPLDGKVVDLRAEYLKLHWSEMLEAARDAAVEAENQRRKKVEDHSGGDVPAKKGDVSKPGEYEISSVSQLDAYLKNKDL